MAGLNKGMIIGNVGTDPEMRYTADGNALTSFRVATNFNYTAPSGERHEETEWFSVVAWRKLAEQCSQFLQKGRRGYVEGRLRTRSWDGRGALRWRGSTGVTRVTRVRSRRSTSTPKRSRSSEVRMEKEIEPGV